MCHDCRVGRRPRRATCSPSAPASERPSMWQLATDELPYCRFASPLVTRATQDPAMFTQEDWYRDC
jgi:hypothetical protein